MRSLTGKVTTKDLTDAVLTLERRIIELEKDHDDLQIAVSTNKGKIDAQELRIDDNETIANKSLGLIKLLTDRLDTSDNNGAATKTRLDTVSKEVTTVNDSLLATGLMAGKLMDRVTKFEEDDRKKTLLVTGFPENPREDLRKICDCLFEDLTLNYGNERVDAVYRLGRFDPDKDKPRTIVLKLAHRGIKGDIYRKVSNLQGRDAWKGVSLLDELSKREAKEFAELRSLYHLAKRWNVKDIKLRQRSLIIENSSYAHKDIASLPYGLTLKAASMIKTTDGIAFKSEHSVFSNLSPCEIQYRDVDYTSLEQALQHQKAVGCGENKVADSILAETDPYEIMNLSKQLNPSKDWNKGVTKMVLELLTLKFNDERRARTLTRTQGKHLYECTFNPIFGVGRHMGNVSNLTFDKVKGGNMLGRLLEKVREEILTKTPLVAGTATPNDDKKDEAARVESTPIQRDESSPAQAEPDDTPNDNTKAMKDLIQELTAAESVDSDGDDDDENEKKDTKTDDEDVDEILNKTMNDILAT